MSSFSKSTSSCSSDVDVDQVRRGPWTIGEDNVLIHYIASHGEGRWNLLAKRSGLKRIGKSCRLRWLNYLKPDVKRGNLTPHEQLLILELHSKWGNRWSKIARHLPGRTDNEIKNYWRTRVQKQARHLKIDTNSSAFEEMIRRIWMPRLMQKIQGSSPSFDIQSQNSTLNYISVPPQVPPQVLSSTSSDICTSPSISSPEHSINIPEHSQNLECPTNPFYATGTNVNTTSFDMESFSLAPMQAETVEFRYPTGDDLAKNNWIDGDNLAECFWDMGAFWQLR